MENLLPKILIYMSAILAILSIIATSLSIYATYKLKKQLLEITDEEALDSVLLTDDIEELGSYLENSLSQVTIFEYAISEQASEKVDRFLDKIQDYLVRTEDLNYPQINFNQIETERYAYVETEIPNELRPIIEELNYGEPWNALAKLRRLIESKLKELLDKNHITTRDNISMNQMFRILVKEEVLPSNMENNFHYIVRICNNAIHGFDISYEEANEIISHARILLSKFPTSSTT